MIRSLPSFFNAGSQYIGTDLRSMLLMSQRRVAISFFSSRKGADSSHRNDGQSKMFNRRLEQLRQEKPYVCLNGFTVAPNPYVHFRGVATSAKEEPAVAQAEKKDDVQPVEKQEGASDLRQATVEIKEGVVTVTLSAKIPKRNWVVHAYVPMKKAGFEYDRISKKFIALATEKTKSVAKRLKEVYESDEVLVVTNQTQDEKDRKKLQVIEERELNFIKEHLEIDIKKKLEEKDIAKAKEFNSIKELLASDFFSGLFADLPEGICPTNFKASIEFTMESASEAVLECELESIVSALHTCIILGLEPGTEFGMSHLVPVDKKLKMIIGYMGFIELARRTGDFHFISPVLVYKHDKFKFDSEQILHKLCVEKDRGPITFAYATRCERNGAETSLILTRKELDQIKSQLPEYMRENDFWKKWEEAMLRKTIVKMLLRRTSLESEAKVPAFKKRLSILRGKENERKFTNIVGENKEKS